MQKNKVLHIAILAGLLMQNVFAAAGDMARGYLTSGKDVYSNGDSLLAGECYALVWIRSGYVFGGFNINGTVVDAVNNDLVAVASVANPSERSPITFLVDADYVGKHTSGDYYVLALDTRCVDGTLAKLGANGFPVQINGWAYAQVTTQPVKKAGVLAASSMTSSAGLVIDIASLIPADLPRPVITKIDTDADGYICLEVKTEANCGALVAEFGEKLETVRTSVSDPVQVYPAKVLRVNTGKKMEGTGFLQMTVVNPMDVLPAKK